MTADASLLEINATFVVEIIAFVVMFLIFARYAYPRIIAAAEARQKQVEEGIRAAEESKRQLAVVSQQVHEQLEEAKAQAREIISRAHQESVAEAEEARVKGRSEAEVILQQAREEIRTERDRAVQDLRTQMAALVVDAAGRLIGQTLDQRAHQRLIDESLTRVGSGNGAERGA